MNCWKYVLYLATILFAFPATEGSLLLAANSEWDDLATLKPGQEIRLVLNDAKSYQGAFQALDDEGITLRQPAGEQTFARKDIWRVDAHSGGRNHRLRNTIIGVAVGASLASTFVLINHSPRNNWFHSTLWVWPLFVGPCAAAGAALPTAGWHEVYRAH
jgi:hypothetical protein